MHNYLYFNYLESENERLEKKLDRKNEEIRDLERKIHNLKEKLISAGVIQQYL